MNKTYFPLKEKSFWENTLYIRDFYFEDCLRKTYYSNSDSKFKTIHANIKKYFFAPKS